MREFILLLTSMIQAADHLLFLKESSLIPVAVPVIIACATAKT